MKACAGCRKEIADDAAFCPMCGSPQAGHDASTAEVDRQQTAPAAPAPPARKRTLLIAGAAALVLLAVAGLATFLLLGRTARGAVVSLTSDQPIAGAAIQCSSGLVKTDDSGRFALPKLRFGSHDVTVTVAGFAPFKTSLRVPLVGSADSEIRVPDASVQVHLGELAQQPRAVDSAKVLIGGTVASRVGTGTYELKGLRPGTWAIMVTEPSHESTRTTVDLDPGKNAVELRVSLTPAETYTRYFQAYKAGQWSEAYAYLHPDITELESIAVFTKDMKAWGTPLSIKVDSTRLLPRWTSPTTSAAYKDVAEIRRTLVVEKQGVHYTNNKPQHWVNVGGLWLRVDI